MFVKWFTAMFAKRERAMFGKWLDILIEKRELDAERIFEVEGDSGTNFISLATVIGQVKIASRNERRKIRDILDILVKKDSCNALMVNLFKHLAGAIAI